MSGGYTFLGTPPEESSLRPSDLSYLGWTQDPCTATSTFALSTAGRLQLMRLKRVKAGSVTRIVLMVTAGGVTLTAGQCFASLYTASGALAGVTADQSTSWQSAGLKTMNLATPYANATTSDLYVGIWYNGTTGPTLARGAGHNSDFLNNGLVSPNLMHAFADTGLTATPPTNFGPQTPYAIALWAAVR